jgi:hypothetical protein
MTEQSLTTVGSVTTEKSRYRTYVKLGTDDKGTVFVSELKVALEANAKDEKTGLAVNWQKLENDGYSVFSENDVVKYFVKGWDGAEVLVPNPEQRLYIFQAGLNSIQSARIGAKIKELAENTTEPTPLYNGTVIDLREDINKPPERGRSMTEIEKIESLLAGLSISTEERAKILLSIEAAKAQLAVQSADALESVEAA